MILSLMIFLTANYTHATGNSRFWSYHENRGNWDVFVEQVGQGEEQSFYLALLNDKPRGGFFRMEPLADGRWALVEVVQVRRGLLGTNVSQEASFLASMRVEDNQHIIELSPTEYGKAHRWDRTIKACNADNKRWKVFDSPTNVTKIIENNKSHDAKIVFDERSIRGTFWRDRVEQDESLYLQKFIPGVYLARTTSYDREASTGLRLEREVQHLCVLWEEFVVFGWYDRMTCLSLPRTQWSDVSAKEPPPSILLQE